MKLYDALDKFICGPQGQTPLGLGVEVTKTEGRPRFVLSKFRLHRGEFCNKLGAVTDFEERLLFAMWNHPKAAQAKTEVEAHEVLASRKYYGPYMSVEYGPYLIIFQPTPDVVRVVEASLPQGHYSITPQIREDFNGNVGICVVQPTEVNHEREKAES